MNLSEVLKQLQQAIEKAEAESNKAKEAAKQSQPARFQNEADRDFCAIQARHVAHCLNRITELTSMRGDDLDRLIPHVKADAPAYKFTASACKLMLAGILLKKAGKVMADTATHLVMELRMNAGHGAPVAVQFEKSIDFELGPCFNELANNLMTEYVNTWAKANNIDIMRK